MAAIAKNPAFAKKVGIKSSVGKEFLTADKGKKFGSGGMATKKMHAEKSEMKSDLAQDKKMIKKAVTMHDKQLHAGKKTNLSKLAKGGAAMGKKIDPRVTRMLASRTASPQDPTKARVAAPMFARGGGIETKGKTKGTMVKMCGGGMKGKK